MAENNGKLIKKLGCLSRLGVYICELFPELRELKSCKQIKLITFQ